MEIVKPRRKLTHNKNVRWFNNIGLSIINIVTLRFLPFLPIAVAYRTEAENIGLFNQVSLPFISEIIITLILLDFVIYVQHYLFHRINFFWIFHRVHHTDIDIDITSGIRFHPIEIIFSSLIKSIFIIILGVNPIAMILFELVLNMSSLFTHANIFIPKKLDSSIRKILVTPDMHRIHHSINFIETNTNFGSTLSIWDKIFRTYKPVPKTNHIEMKLGLPHFRKQKYNHLNWLIITPFVSRKNK